MVDIITSSSISPTPIHNPKDIMDYWPMTSPPRKTQEDVLGWLPHLEAHKRFIMIEAPVGAGKSPLGLTYAGFLGDGALGSSYILTPQRILQRQYEEAFGDKNLISVYGKSNYMCNMKLGLNCDDGSDIKPKCSDCPASKAFQNIKQTPHVVLNYKLAMLYSEMFQGMTEFPEKDLMVFDECHTLEGHLVNHRAVEITRNKCEKHKIVFYQPTDIVDAHGWLRENYYPDIDKACYDQEQIVKAIDAKYEFSTSPSLMPDELRSKREFKKLSRHRDLVRSLAEQSIDYIRENYVMVTEKGQKVMFKEIYGKRLFKSILQPKAERFLFMSSTIMNFESYAKDLGIDPEEMATVSLPSEFDVDNRPVYFMPTAKMTFGWQKNEPAKNKLRKAMSDQVIKLCSEMHDSESGIIHTGSFQIAKWLIGEIQDHIPQKIVTHVGDDPQSRDACIAEFTENDGKVPMVIISPSLTEGLDLKDDMARFCIFTKVPYPFLGDEWVKRRLDLSDEWYQRQAMTGIIQGGGRIVRGPEDYGNTYILDESFGMLWNRYKSRAPKWWKDGYSKLT